MNNEKVFEKIINEAIEEAEQVDCDFAKFVEGLELMLSQLEERLAGARDEADPR